MKLTTRGNILSNGRIRRTKKSFSKEKIGDVDLAKYYCNRCGHRFCSSGDGLEREIKLCKKYIKNQCNNYL